MDYKKNWRASNRVALYSLTPHAQNKMQYVVLVNTEKLEII